jgi:hypothetical protein
MVKFTSLLVFLGLMLMSSVSHAQYYIPQQAWGHSYNYGYGAYRNNYNSGYNNYQGFNNYNNNYRSQSSYSSEPSGGTYYMNKNYNPVKSPPAYNSNPNPVTEENRYFYPQNNKSMYPPVEYKWPSPHENRAFSYPTVRGVVIPETPTYSSSAGKRK